MVFRTQSAITKESLVLFLIPQAQYFLQFGRFALWQRCYRHTLPLRPMKSTITIDVTLDPTRMPEDIQWSATESSIKDPRQAKAMILSFWDGEDKSALRIDLWTRKMMVDEMADFFFQTMMSMADTYDRATKQTELVNEMKQFAQNFYQKFQQAQIKENQ